MDKEDKQKWIDTMALHGFPVLKDKGKHSMFDIKEFWVPVRGQILNRKDNVIHVRF